jgi:sporulation-control protein spo0M
MLESAVDIVDKDFLLIRKSPFMVLILRDIEHMLSLIQTLPRIVKTIS